MLMPESVKGISKSVTIIQETIILEISEEQAQRQAVLWIASCQLDCSLLECVFVYGGSYR
jgi:hypothetical protein